MGRDSFWMHLAERSGIPAEAVPGVPVIEIGGDRRVLIENHQGVTEYDTNRIQVKVRYGLICIHGESLELVSMTGSGLVVRGIIHNVELIRGG